MIFAHTGFTFTKMTYGLLQYKLCYLYTESDSWINEGAVKIDSKKKDTETPVKTESVSSLCKGKLKAALVGVYDNIC